MAEETNRSAGVIRSTKEFLSEMSPDKNPAQKLTQPSSSGDNDRPIIIRTGHSLGIALQTPSAKKRKTYGLPLGTLGSLTVPGSVTQPVKKKKIPPLIGYPALRASETGDQILSLLTDGICEAIPNKLPVLLRDSSRAIRNRAEKLRRDDMNNSICKLGAMLPAVVAANKKVDKTGILRLTAHYLRSRQYVFGDIFAENMKTFSDEAAKTLLRAMNGFILTTTYKGIVVVVSEQVTKHLGYSVVELLGRNVLNIVHVDDQEMMLRELVPTCVKFGPHGELLLPDDPDAVNTVNEMLTKERRNFFVRFIRQSRRAEPRQYQMCHVRGSFRKSDRACSTIGRSRCCQMMYRMRNRGEIFTSSGNDVVFIGFVQPMCETFMRERHMESFKMEYRTRHSIDGEILQSDHRISMITGYLTNEVVGVNAMNFMHKDDVRWVIIALREMYDKHRLIGESCYRLLTKTGEFLYMKTRGQLEVDHSSGAVSTFVCVNTVVEEDEGAALIKKMKQKYSVMVGSGDCVQDTSVQELNVSMPAVEHPDRLKKVIIHLVSELPYSITDDELATERFDGIRRPLSIIPRQPEVIVTAIEKSYEVIPHRAPIQSSANLPQDHNEPTPGSNGIKTNAASNDNSTYQSQTNLLDYESNSNDLYNIDVPFSDIALPILGPIEIDDINETTNFEFLIDAFDSDSNLINEVADDHKTSDIAQPGHNDTSKDEEPRSSAAVCVYKLNYGLTEIVGPPDTIELTSGSIGKSNNSTNTKNEKSTDSILQRQIQSSLNPSTSSYNLTYDRSAIGATTDIAQPAVGLSGINSQKYTYNSMMTIGATTDIAEPIAGPSGINRQKYPYNSMVATGATTDMAEPAAGPSGIDRQKYPYNSMMANSATTDIAEPTAGPSGINRQKYPYNSMIATGATTDIDEPTAGPSGIDRQKYSYNSITATGATTDISEPTAGPSGINHQKYPYKSMMATCVITDIAEPTAGPSGINRQKYPNNSMTATGPTAGPSGIDRQKYPYNSMMANSATTDISESTAGPSGISHQKYPYKSMMATCAITDIAEPTAGPSGINRQKYQCNSMMANGATSDIAEPTAGPSGINRKKYSYSSKYDLSSEAHVSLSKRDQLLAEAQNIGNLPLSMDGAASSTRMKRANSSDGDDGNTKKFCDETQLTYNYEDNANEQQGTEFLLDGLFVSQRMQVILDNVINTIQDRVINDDPYVDDSWWDEAQQSVVQNPQGDKHPE